MLSRLLPLTALAVCSSPALAVPDQDIFVEFLNLYPTSFTAPNGSCMTCHEDFQGGPPWNSYGWGVRGGINSGLSVSEAILAMENLNSDGDPDGWSNLEEIMASTQPGWTLGPNNTVYAVNGNPTNGVTPPDGVVGDVDPLDPCGATTVGNYCASSPFSTGSASSINVSPALISLAANPTITVTADNLPSQFGIFIAGPSQAAIPFFNGTLCIAPATLQRFSAINAPAGGVIAQDFTLGSAAPGGLDVVAGQAFHFQRWNRDPAAGGGAANFSDGFTVCVLP